MKLYFLVAVIFVFLYTQRNTIEPIILSCCGGMVLNKDFKETDTEPPKKWKRCFAPNTWNSFPCTDVDSSECCGGKGSCRPTRYGGKCERENQGNSSKYFIYKDGIEYDYTNDEEQLDRTQSEEEDEEEEDDENNSPPDLSEIFYIICFIFMFILLLILIYKFMYSDSKITVPGILNGRPNIRQSYIPGSAIRPGQGLRPSASVRPSQAQGLRPNQAQGLRPSASVRPSRALRPSQAQGLRPSASVRPSGYERRR